MDDLTRAIVHENVRSVSVSQSQYVSNDRSCSYTPGVIQSYCKPSSRCLVQLSEVVPHYWFEALPNVREGFQNGRGLITTLLPYAREESRRLGRLHVLRPIPVGRRLDHTVKRCG